MIYNRIYMQISEQEGFAQQQQSETIQYREYYYTPLHYSKSFHHNPYKTQMKIQSIKLIHHEQYINKQLQDYLSHKFTSKHKQVIAQPCKNIQKVNTNYYFDSNFQTGNLQYVIYRNHQYQLYLKPDTNTTSHFQWFYFKIRNKEIGTMSIVIKNFIKSKMLYREGLRPFHKSINSNAKTYQQISTNVHFRQSSQRCETRFYQLAFQYTFISTNDEVEFCSQPPYSYSRYCKIYRPLPFPKMQISRTVLSHKIQAFIVNQNANSNSIVVVMARQHPGQSMGSWMMQGFVNKLIQNPNPICWILLPMINIDGVILGNNRTGVQGYDLNRNWSIEQGTNGYHLFPELKGIIGYFKRKKREHHFKKIKMFIDFHSHSSEQNVFSFGPPHNKSSEYYDLSRIYPYLISKRNNDFNLKQCNYRIDPQKKNCSRSIFYSKFNFSYSYTIQSSFGIYRGRRINQKDASRMGESIFMSTLEFVQLLMEQKQKNIQLKDIVNRMKEEVTEVQNDQDLDDSGSEDEEEAQIPLRTEFNKKLTALLTNQTQQYHQTVFNSLVKKTTNNSYLQVEKKSLRQSRLRMSRKQDKEDRQNRHIKTVQQQKYVIKSSSKNEKSTTLPKINFTKRKLSKNKKKNEICDLDKLSLQQMKERLIKMKNSELGRRILLINRHQNS